MGIKKLLIYFYNKKRRKLSIKIYGIEEVEWWESRTPEDFKRMEEFRIYVKKRRSNI